MEAIIYRAGSRGYFNHGWLRTHHTFSFADYYDPTRINFGTLRVLNDDSIDPGTGFGLHPHRNMEVVSIPLSGALVHTDNLGNSSVLEKGEIQVMSAGTGIHHSEYNQSKEGVTEFLQIWVIPDKLNVKPRYENAVIRDLIKKNEISEVVSPYPGTGKGLWIYQQAWFSIGELGKESQHTYRLKSRNSFGVYLFVIEGSVEIEDIRLDRRDGLGIYDTDAFDIRVHKDSTLLLIEVPPAKEE
ncbi:MAG: pirin family protein [Culturomica sp.]|jgi:redox-sensitive bicupin YhaK (pirin superfamily)|nr:pirin family protein [Culturomica sp.]